MALEWSELAKPLPLVIAIGVGRLVYKWASKSTASWDVRRVFGLACLAVGLGIFFFIGSDAPLFVVLTVGLSLNAAFLGFVMAPTPESQR